jgi:hypothetical protein
VEVKAIACELPTRLGRPLSRFQVPDIRTEVIGRGLVAEISGATIWRWLAEDAIRPWAHRSWIFPRDPDFEPKAARVLDLYARQWHGEPLGEDDYVVSADEKTSIQCRCRCDPTLPPAHSQAMRVEVVLDCLQPDRLAQFLAEALGYRRAPSGGPYMVLVPDRQPGPERGLQRRLLRGPTAGPGRAAGRAAGRLLRRNGRRARAARPPGAGAELGEAAPPPRSPARWCGSPGRCWDPPEPG